MSQNTPEALFTDSLNNNKFYYLSTILIKYLFMLNFFIQKNI